MTADTSAISRTRELRGQLAARLLRVHGIAAPLVDLGLEVKAEVQEEWALADSVRDLVTLRMLEAFQCARVSDQSLHGSTGYGYADVGREACEAVYSAYFHTEAALVRPQIASGTHALTCCLFGLLRPGDELVSLAGAPYDTLEKVIGAKPGSVGALSEFGIGYKEVALTPEGRPDPSAILAALGPRAKVALLQRSRGYADRPSISVDEIGSLVRLVKKARPEVVFFVDNCYGEFVEESEPTHVGADIMAGSLIKNPGGSIVPTGGYIVGRRALVEAAAARLTAPGVGSAIGATLDMPRLLLQGFFMGPMVVAEAVKGAIFVARLFERLGFGVSPRFDAARTDIVQSIAFGRPDLLVGFCQGLQKASPVESFVVLEPAEMPGYSDMVVMAGGTFISGSSIEMSADGALRPPYSAYYQGGISSSQVVIGALMAASEMLRSGLLQRL